MNATSRPVPNPVVVLREEADQWAILFNPDTGDAAGINPVGLAIWKLLDGTLDVAAAHLAVRKQFADAPEASADQVRSFLAELQAMGFATVED